MKLSKLERSLEISSDLFFFSEALSSKKYF